MSAEELRERVTFSKRGQAVDDGYGNVVTDFVDQFTVAARIKPRLGGEEVLAARLSGRTLATITVRYSAVAARITSDWKAVDARTGEEWNIKASPINTDEHRQWLEMLCEKGSPT